MLDDPSIEPMAAEDEALVAWIDAHWEELAAFAWRGYLTQGRGVVLVERAGHGEVVVGYETPSVAAADGAAWPDDLQEALVAYTPTTDVLFLVEPEGAGTLIGMRAAPPCLSPWEAGQAEGPPAVARSA